MKNLKLIPVLEIILAIAMAGLIVNGCKKDNNNNSLTDNNTVMRTMYDNSISESSFDDAGNIADEGVTGSLGSFRNQQSEGALLTSCANITLNLNAEPHSAIIDFGATDCLGKDGNYRRGKILVTWSGNYRDEGSSHTITFDNYYLNFNKIEGVKTVTNTGRNSKGNLVFSVTVNGTILVDAQYSPTGQGGTITWSASKLREWTKGEKTLVWKDDVYLITGNAHGTNTAGISYTVASDGNAPLKREIGFAHFTSGILNIQDSEGTTSSIDYSYLNGQKDDLARVTVNGDTYTIHLGMRTR